MQFTLQYVIISTIPLYVLTLYRWKFFVSITQYTLFKHPHGISVRQHQSIHELENTKFSLNMIMIWTKCMITYNSYCQYFSCGSHSSPTKDDVVTWILILNHHLIRRNDLPDNSSNLIAGVLRKEPIKRHRSFWIHTETCIACGAITQLFSRSHDTKWHPKSNRWMMRV